MNPELDKLYTLMGQWGYLPQGRTKDDFVAAHADPAKQTELYAFLKEEKRITKMDDATFRTTYFTGLAPVKKKEGGEVSSPASLAGSSSSSVAAPVAGIATEREGVQPGDLLTDQVQRDAPAAPANMAFAEQPKMLAPLTGDEPVQDFAEGIRKTDLPAYDYRKKYDEQTPVRQAKRQAQNAEMYGQRAQVQRNYAADQLSLDMGSGWEQRLKDMGAKLQELSVPLQEKAGKMEAIKAELDKFDAKTADQNGYAEQNRRVAEYNGLLTEYQEIKKDYDPQVVEYKKIVEHPYFKQWDDAGKATNAAFKSYQDAIGNPAYTEAINARKAAQKEKDAGQGVVGRYVDATARTGVKVLSDLITLPRTLARSGLGANLIAGPLAGGVKPDANEFNATDALGGWGDALMEITDTYIPKASQYEQQVFETAAPFEGVKVVLGRDGKIARVKNEQGQVVDVDSDFEKRFNESGAAAKAKTEFTGVDNTLDKVGGLATDMALMIAAGGGTKAGTFLTSFTQIQGDAYREGIQDLKMSPNDAAEYALTTAALQGGIEAGVGNIESAFMRGGRASGRLSTQEVKALSGTMRPSQLAMARLKPMIESIGGENAEEFLQGITDNAVKADFNERTGAGMNTEMSPEEVKETILLTTLVSAPFGGMQSLTAVDDMKRRATFSLTENPERFNNLLGQLVQGGGLDEVTAQRMSQQGQRLAQYAQAMPPMTEDMKSDLLAKEWARMQAQAVASDPNILPAQAVIAEKEAVRLEKEIEAGLQAADKDPDALPEREEKAKVEGTRIGSLIVPTGAPKERAASIDVAPALSDDFRENDSVTGQVASAYANSEPLGAIEGNQDEIADVAIQELKNAGYDVRPDEQLTVKRYFVESLQGDEKLAAAPLDEAFRALTEEYIESNTDERPLRERVKAETIEDRIADFFARGGKVSPASFDRYGDSNWRKDKSMSPLYFAGSKGVNIDQMAQSWAADEQIGGGLSEAEIIQRFVNFMEQFPKKNVNTYLSARVAEQEEEGKRARRERLFTASEENGLDEVSPEERESLLNEVESEVGGMEVSEDTVAAADKWLSQFADEDGVVDVKAMREALLQTEVTPLEEGFDNDRSVAWDELGLEGQQLVKSLAGSVEPLEVQVKAKQYAPVEERLEAMGASLESVLADFRDEDGTLDIVGLEAAWDAGGFLEWADTLTREAYEKIETILENGNEETEILEEGDERNDRPSTEYQTPGDADATPADRASGADQGGQSVQTAERQDDAGRQTRPTVSETGAVEDIVSEAELALSDVAIDAALDKINRTLQKVTLPTRLTPRLVSEMADQGLLTLDETDALHDWLSGADVRPEDVVVNKAEASIGRLREVPDWMGPYRAAQVAAAREVAVGTREPNQPIIVEVGPELLIGNVMGREAALKAVGMEQRGSVWAGPAMDRDRILADVFEGRVTYDEVKDSNAAQGAGSFKGSVARFLSKPAGYAAFRSGKFIEPRDAKVEALGKFLSEKYGVEVVTDMAQVNEALRQMGRSELIDNPTVKGFVYQGKVYLTMGAQLDTPIHEFGHLWEQAIEKIDTDLHSQGLAAMEGSTYLQRVLQNPMYLDLDENGLRKEALALAIGERGAILQGGAWDRFMDFLDTLWRKVKSAFGIDVRDMNAREFADYVSTVLLNDVPADIDLKEDLLGLIGEVEGRIVGESTPEARFLFARNRLVDAAVMNSARLEIRESVESGKPIVGEKMLRKIIGKNQLDIMYAEELRRAGIRMVSPRGDKAFSEKKIWGEKLRLWFYDQFRVRGNAPKSVHERNLQRKGEINAATYAMGQALRRLEKSVNAYVYGPKWSDRIKKGRDVQKEGWIYQQVQNVLEGTQPLQTLDVSLWDNIAELRKRTDDLSRTMVLSGAVGPGMAITILRNGGVDVDAAVIEETQEVGRILAKRPEEREAAENDLVEKYLNDYGGDFGKYLYRSYRSNDDADWKTKVPEHIRWAAEQRIKSDLREAMMSEADALESKNENFDEKIAEVKSDIEATLDKARAVIRAERQALAEVVQKQRDYEAEKGRSNKNLEKSAATTLRRLKAMEDMLRKAENVATLSPLDFALIASTRDFDAAPANAVMNAIYGKRKAILAIEERREKADAASYARLESLTHRLNNVGNEIDTILQRNSPAALMSGSRLGSKDQQVVRGRRKDIAEEYRDLLGEYRDPRVNLMRSALRISTATANQRFLGDVRSMGLSEGWLATKETKSGDLTVEIATEGSSAMNPLNGLWTTPVIAKVFNAPEKINLDGWMKWYFRAVGATKLSKTVLASAAQSRNLLSNVLQATRNGWIANPTGGSWKGFLNGLKAYNVVQTKEFADYMTKLQRLGVIGTSVTAGDLRQQAEMMSNDMGGNEFGDFSDMLNPVAGPVSKAYRGLKRIYQATDELLKLWGFAVEGERYAQALYKKPYAELNEKQQAEVDERAARVIRLITPDYDLIPKIGDTLRKLPITGSFVSFPLEQYRTFSNWFTLVREELKDEKTRSIGLTRIAFASAYVGAVLGLAAWSAAAIGMSDEEEAAVTPLLKPWQRNTTKIWLSKDEKTGEIQFFSLGYVDPFAFWKAPLNRLTTDNDQKFTEDLVAGAADVFAPILQPDLLAATLTETMLNYNRTTGKPIRVEGFGMWHPENLARTKKFVRERLQPGFLKTFYDTKDAYEGGKMTEYGGIVDVEAVGMNAIGLNTERIRPKVAFERSLIGDRMVKENLLDALQGTQYKEAREVARMKDGGEFTEEQIARRQKQADERLEYMTTISTEAYTAHLKGVGKKVQRANQALGIPMDAIIAELKEKRYSNDELEVVLGRKETLAPKMKTPKF